VQAFKDSLATLLGMEVHFGSRHADIQKFSASLDMAKQALGSDTISLGDLWGTFCLLALSTEYAGVRAVIDYETGGKPQSLSSVIPKVLHAPVPEQKTRHNAHPKAYLAQNKLGRCPHKWPIKNFYKCTPCDACKEAGYAFSHTPGYPIHCTVAIRSSSANKDSLKAYSASSHFYRECETWIVVSGATDHMAQSSASFSQYFPCTRQILTASSEGLNSPGTGTCTSSSGSLKVDLSKTLHCPDLASNLMSVPRLAQQDTSQFLIQKPHTSFLLMLAYFSCQKLRRRLF
jgi:hypothetical protein